MADFASTVREQRQRVAGDRAVMAGTGEGLVDRSVALQQVDRGSERIVVDLAGLQRALPELALAIRSAPHREDDGEGDLTLAKIVTDLLAELGLAAAIVERVVDQLEGDAEIGAVGAACRLFRLGRCQPAPVRPRRRRRTAQPSCRE